MLTMQDREEISRGIAENLTGKEIAARIGRCPSVISREISRHGGRRRYRATRAEQAAGRARRRPKPRRLDADPVLRLIVTGLLERGWSPEAIAYRLPIDHPCRQAVRVSHEAVYSWIYALPVGVMRAEGIALRSGRTRRRPARGRVPRAPRITGMRFIDERPADAAGRAVPGHWEGDLVVGRNCASAVSTLVERTSRYLILVPLASRDSATVTASVAERIKGLPAALRRTLTWDCGAEMARHAALSVAADIEVYFAHPHSPWERGTNENTNRWLREYFPKGTTITSDPGYLQAVADELNDRPRRILGWRKPNEVFAELLTSGIASTS
ncbi:IS30 family transposase [Sinosporangium album]|nr:IS30 family transposase [Sinosporangium album]